MRRALLSTVLLLAASPVALPQRTFYGFDKNAYPGDDVLPTLHRTFAFAGYWLNNPPGMTSNPWAGKRATLRAAGFGFLVLFNGRLDAQLRGQDAAALGGADAASAIAAAKHEDFPTGTVLFLDQEEGGALLPEQAAYLGAWIAAVHRSSFEPGVYCSGIAVPSGSKKIATAQDVARRFPGTKLWIWNDRCPPAPGCVVWSKALDPAKSGFAQSLVWQYARSPRSSDNTAACRGTYAPDNGCYAPGLPHSPQSWVDLNVSRSPDPSHGR